MKAFSKAEDTKKTFWIQTSPRLVYFLRPLLVKTDKQVSQMILDRINTGRQLLGFPPLDLWQEADQFAQNLAERKAKGLVLPDIPPEFRETLIVFLSTPSLTQKEIDFPEAVNPRYNKGTLGIWFGKNEDYSGGVYVLTLMLFAEDITQTLSVEEQKIYVFKLVNKIRIQSGLKELILDEQLTEAADRMAAKAARRKGSEGEIIPEYNRYKNLTYGTENLTRLPGSLNSAVKETHLRKIGIGLVYKKNQGSQKGTFFISIIFE